MLKAKATLMAMALCIVAVRAQEPKSDSSLFDLDFEEDVFPEETSLNFESSRTGGELGGVILAVKDQVKDILLDIGLQVFEYFKVLFHGFRVKLLKKFGLYTLKDVFHAVFDGVTDLVVESSPEIMYYKTEAPKPVIDTRFSLATLFNKR